MMILMILTFKIHTNEHRLIGIQATTGKFYAKMNLKSNFRLNNGKRKQLGRYYYHRHLSETLAHWTPVKVAGVIQTPLVLNCKMPAGKSAAQPTTTLGSWVNRWILVWMLEPYHVLISVTDMGKWWNLHTEKTHIQHLPWYIRNKKTTFKKIQLQNHLKKHKSQLM